MRVLPAVFGIVSLVYAAALAVAGLAGFDLNEPIFIPLTVLFLLTGGGYSLAHARPARGDR